MSVFLLQLNSVSKEWREEIVQKEELYYSRNLELLIKKALKGLDSYNTPNNTGSNSINNFRVEQSVSVKMNQLTRENQYFLYLEMQEKNLSQALGHNQSLNRSNDIQSRVGGRQTQKRVEEFSLDEHDVLGMPTIDYSPCEKRPIKVEQYNYTVPVGEWDSLNNNQAD